MPFYFCPIITPEYCYEKKVIQEMLKAEGIEQAECFKAKPIIGQGLFWCDFHAEPGTVEDSDCGNTCFEYKPRNGKNGRCVYSGYCYEPGEKIKIKSI